MMVLFEMKKYTEREYVISPQMQAVIDSSILDESQVKKFDRFPELLNEELKNEERWPDYSNLENDIFQAIYNNDYIKFFQCAARVEIPQNILTRLYYWLISKENFTIRDAEVLKKIEEKSSVYSVFDY